MRALLVVSLSLLGCSPAPLRLAVDVSGAPRALEDFPRIACGAVDAAPEDPVRPQTPQTPEVKAAVEATRLPLEDALLARDEAGLSAAVCQLRSSLGRWRGVPEAIATYTPAAPAALSTDEAVSVLERALLSQVGREVWHSQPSTSGVDVHRPLRDVCELVRTEALGIALVPARRAEIEPSLRVGLAWLLAVQRVDGLFPFPDLEDEFEADRAACERTSGAERSECERALAGNPARLVKGIKQSIVDRGASLDDFFRDGWFIRDPLPRGNDGGLQFDNGVCGEALLIAGLVLDDPALLAASRRAAAWARAQALAPNWNYNAFSVRLMAWQALVDGDVALGEAALDKAWWGILPGQLANGRWVDGHNARVVYHVILMASLAPLVPHAVARKTAISSALEASLASYADELAAAKGTAGDDRGIRALVETAATRPLTDGERAALDVLRRNAISTSGPRVSSAVDLLLAERGAHPLVNRLSWALGR
ncbi:MAG: hypothetical protein SFW67_26515 [Myxococcaceae bacterium]|nr:hypothetical protein [Myxococcaceae bacterium]